MLSLKRFQKLALWGLLAGLSVFAFTNCDNGFVVSNKGDASFDSLSNECGPSRNLSPKTIDQALQLINELPKPLTVACFISHFRKPLEVFAVNNQFSAQPAVGFESPRIFIFSGNLVVSVVPAGHGRDVIEFSEITALDRSFKGELAFPVTEVLPPSAPYSKILEGLERTSCNICHQLESRVTTITTGEAYNSQILRPDPFKRVDQESLLWFSQKCNSAEDAERCRILNAVFINGRARDVDFPEGPR